MRPLIINNGTLDFLLDKNVLELKSFEAIVALIFRYLQIFGWEAFIPGNITGNAILEKYRIRIAYILAIKESHFEFFNTQ